MHSLQLNHEARFYSGLAHSESLGLTKQADSCTDIFTKQHFPQRPLFVILNCCTYFPFLSKETIHSILSVKDLFLFLLISVFFWGWRGPRFRGTGCGPQRDREAGYRIWHSHTRLGQACLLEPRAGNNPFCKHHSISGRDHPGGKTSR